MIEFCLDLASLTAGRTVTAFDCSLSAGPRLASWLTKCAMKESTACQGKMITLKGVGKTGAALGEPLGQGRQYTGGQMRKYCGHYHLLQQVLRAHA